MSSPNALTANLLEHQAHSWSTPASIIPTPIRLASAAGGILIPQLVGKQPPAQQPLSQSLALLPFLKLIIHAALLRHH